MNLRQISKVLLDSTGRLLVVPKLERGTAYEYIYREPNGLRWSHELGALYAYEPIRWDHEELLRDMASALRAACDEELVITEHTEWEGVSPDLQVKLRGAISGAA